MNVVSVLGVWVKIGISEGMYSLDRRADAARVLLVFNGLNALE